MASCCGRAGSFPLAKRALSLTGRQEREKRTTKKKTKKDESRAKLRYKMLSYYYLDADHALITLSNRLLETVPKYLLVR
jgi:hypothetical protein